MTLTVMLVPGLLLALSVRTSSLVNYTFFALVALPFRMCSCIWGFINGPPKRQVIEVTVCACCSILGDRF